MEIWVGTKYLVFYNVYNVPTFFYEIYERGL